MRGVCSATKKRWLASLMMVGLPLLAQFAMAAQASLPLQAGPVGALGQALAEECCDGMPTESDACLKHCLMQDHAAASLPQHFRAVSASTAIVSATFPLLVTPSSSLGPSITQLPGGPSLQILYCSYQS